MNSTSQTNNGPGYIGGVIVVIVAAVLWGLCELLFAQGLLSMIFETIALIFVCVIPTIILFAVFWVISKVAGEGGERGPDPAFVLIRSLALVTLLIVIPHFLWSIALSDTKHKFHEDRVDTLTVLKERDARLHAWYFTSWIDWDDNAGMTRTISVYFFWPPSADDHTYLKYIEPEDRDF